MRRSISFTLGCGILALAACERPPAQFAVPPPPEVTVSRPIVRPVEDTLEFSARTRGVEEVEIRARVKGFLENKESDGGRRVKTGDLLFIIDPREYEAAVGQAKARVASASSSLRIAQITLDRAKDAMAQQAATQQEVDQNIALRDSAQADLDLAKAQLTRAELDLEFTRLTAPIDGRTSIVSADVGQLVGASDPTLLATVINDARIYATFEIDERTLLDLRKAASNLRPGEGGRPDLPIRMRLANEADFLHEGRFDHADNTVDPETGTITIEAIFDNKDRTILPGLFVRVEAIFGIRDAMLVPDLAVLADQIGRFVLIVNDDGVVERRDVQVGGVFDRLRQINSGLESTDRVIVNGVQRARTGEKAMAHEEPVAEPRLRVPAALPAPVSAPAAATP